MQQDSPNAGGIRPNANIWSPWRMEYIESLGRGGECFLCGIRDNPQKDRENLVVWRGRRAMTVLNRFPYTGGHSLVSPMAHVGNMDELDDATVLEIMAMVRDVQKALAAALRAEGFNVGINIGRCAGAGLPGHLHVHVVPRWSGDTNFMAVLGDVRVIPDALVRLREKIVRAGEELGLPRLGGPGAAKER
ncbi:MAG: HIT domain-containing protein [Planctomycetes bacterium]|nr:HIT domain-containing protein [Planctomycetota bacterium]